MLRHEFEHPPSLFIERGNLIFKQIERRLAYLSTPDALATPRQTQALLGQITQLEAEIAQSGVNDLFIQELGRRLYGEKIIFQSQLQPVNPSPEMVIDAYNIPKTDLDNLEVWLTENRPAVEAASDYIYEHFQQSKRVSPFLGSPEIRQQSEILLLVQVSRIKDFLTHHFLHLPGMANVLSQYHLTIDSWENRSYAHKDAKVAALSTRASVFFQDGTLQVDPETILSLIGHELMGHVRNYINSNSASFPSFISSAMGEVTSSTRESVAQYFERKFLDYLTTHPSAGDELGFEEDIHAIHTRYKDRLLLKEYWDKINQYGIYLLSQGADSKMDTDSCREHLIQHSISPGFAANFFDRHKYHWDPVTHKLLPGVVSELRYAANPVNRVISACQPEQVHQTEQLILMGFWTPVGLEEWVKFKLANNN